MASYSAKLEVDGQVYPVILCTYDFAQATGSRGRVRERVRHGLLELVLDVPANDQLMLWAATPHYPLDGHVSFYQASEFMAHETVAFKAGQCVSYREVFEAGADLIGSYRCALTIAAPKLELLAGGAPGSSLHTAAGAATRVAAVAASIVNAPTTIAVSALNTAPTVASWLVALEQKMGPGVKVQAIINQLIGGGLSETKIKSAFRQSVDQELVFERLTNAKRGIYQHRVIIDDYEAIPGVSQQKFSYNGLPQQAIAARDFGVDDPALDLPAEKAITFTNSARLVELKPGEKLYRVANDPSTDRYGRTGSYWTRVPPASLATVIGGTAVMPEWNDYQKVYEFTVPDAAAGVLPYYAWEGPAAAQHVSGDYPDKIDNGYCLLGGDNQLFVPTKFTRAPEFDNHIADVTHQHKSW